jgi:hypothetical protein
MTETDVTPAPAGEPPCFDSDFSGMQDAIRQVRQAHFRMIWLTGSPPARRSAFVNSVASRLGCPLLRVGKELSSSILEQPAPLRPAVAEGAFYDMLLQSKAETICLDHLEILFDQSLMLKGADLIRNASRRFVLIASWPGTADATSLAFGPADHPSHFRISFSEMECPVYQLSNS